MGRYGAYDLYIAPFVRDSTVFLPMLIFWFVLQRVLSVMYTRFLGHVFTRLALRTRQDIVVRTVSALNGFLMIGAAVCFISSLHAHNFTLPTEYYEEIPGYRFFRISIVSYFAWDIIVCFVYRWDGIWKVHAIASFTGAYLLSFPFSDQYASYFTGMFELSNAPLHISTILRTLEMRTVSSVVFALEALFAVMFTIIRVFGGTIVTGMWLKLTCTQLLGNYKSGGRLLHGEVPVLISAGLIVIVQLLQYIWFVQIVGRAFSTIKVMLGTWRKKATA